MTLSMHRCSGEKQPSAPELAAFTIASHANVQMSPRHSAQRSPAANVERSPNCCAIVGRESDGTATGATANRSASIASTTVAGSGARPSAPPVYVHGNLINSGAVSVAIHGVGC